jgi:hypothetical protein
MNRDIISIQQVAQAIRFVRGERILLDFDLARLYAVTTKLRRATGFHVRERAALYRTGER